MIAASSCDLNVSDPCESTVDATCTSSTKRDLRDIADATSRTKHDMQDATLCSGLSGFPVLSSRESTEEDSVAPSEGRRKVTMRV